MAGMYYILVYAVETSSLW